jgi:hypothetical protein
MTTSDKKPRRTTKSTKTPKAADSAAPAVAHTAAPAVTDTPKARAAPASPEPSTTPGLANAAYAGRSTRSAKSREARIKDISVSMTSRHREDRHASIALAAYFRSESRGFAPGHEVEDWLAAEEEVDQRLLGEGRVS